MKSITITHFVQSTELDIFGNNNKAYDNKQQIINKMLQVFNLMDIQNV